MDKEQIERLINQRFHEISRDQKYIRESLLVFRKDLFDLNVHIEKKVENSVNELIASEGFLKGWKKFIISCTEQEVKVVLSEKGINKIIIAKLEEHAATILSNLSQEQIFSFLVKKTLDLQRDYFKLQSENTKNLVYSIDSEIKHLSQREGLSYETEKILLEKLKEFSYKSFQNKQLEN